MPIYLGVDGVVREAAELECGLSVLYHGTSCLVGVDGAARQTLDWTAGLDHFEVVPTIVYCCNLDAQGNDTDYVWSAVEAQKYGTITITDNSISVRCDTIGKMICVGLDTRAVFRDGHKVSLYKIKGAELPVIFTVGYYMLTRNGNGQYSTYFNGEDLYLGYYSGSVSGNKTISWLNVGSAGGIHAGMTSGSGYCIVQQNYLKVEINGKSYPIKAINNLDSLT
ncbi:hypothetical protein [uncultured Agathobaculum sp.]|uniref:hypothetical protein n=1 Tax=uncultured Agathobaculum sp. TaxID=2048140 RepID=UPI00296F6C49